METWHYYVYHPQLWHHSNPFRIVVLLRCYPMISQQNLHRYEYALIWCGSTLISEMSGFLDRLTRWCMVAGPYWCGRMNSRHALHFWIMLPIILLYLKSNYIPLLLQVPNVTQLIRVQYHLDTPQQFQILHHQFELSTVIALQSLYWLYLELLNFHLHFLQFCLVCH